MIFLTLDKLLIKRKMSKATLIKLTGIDSNVIDDYFNNNTRNISLDHLDVICKTLRCTTMAIISFTNDSKSQNDNIDYESILNKYRNTIQEKNFEEKIKTNLTSEDLDEMFDDEFWNSIIKPTEKTEQKSRLSSEDLNDMFDEDFWNE